MIKKVSRKDYRPRAGWLLDEDYGLGRMVSKELKMVLKGYCQEGVFVEIEEGDLEYYTKLLDDRGLRFLDGETR